MAEAKIIHPFVPEQIKLKNTTLYQKLRDKTKNLLTIAILLFVGAIALIYFDFSLGYLFFSYGSIILFGIGMYQIILVKKRFDNMTVHPDFQAMLRYDAPEKLMSHFEKEINGKKRIYDDGGYMITENFIVIEKFFRYHIIYKSEVVWVYILRTKHSVNLIPAGSTYEVILNLNDGRSIHIKRDEEEVKKFIGYIAKIAPFAVYGFNETLKEYWNNNTFGFINEVYFRQRDYYQHHENLSKKTKDIKK
jgi:hypothetical protein